jgi:hypothetical protein
MKIENEWVEETLEQINKLDEEYKERDKFPPILYEQGLIPWKYSLEECQLHINSRFEQWLEEL